MRGGIASADQTTSQPKLTTPGEKDGISLTKPKAPDDHECLTRASKPVMKIYVTRKSYDVGQRSRTNNVQNFEELQKENIKMGKVDKQNLPLA